MVRVMGTHADTIVGRLFREGYTAVQRFVRGRVHADAVDDVVSDVFVAVTSAVKEGRVADPSQAWLIGIARHKVVDHWRACGRQQRITERVRPHVQLVTQVEPEAIVVEADAVDGCFAALSPRHRRALTLKYADGQPVAAVASAMGMSLRASESLLARARRALAQELALAA